MLSDRRISRDRGPYLPDSPDFWYLIDLSAQVDQTEVLSAGREGHDSTACQKRPDGVPVQPRFGHEGRDDGEPSMERGHVLVVHPILSTVDFHPELTPFFIEKRPGIEYGFRVRRGSRSVLPPSFSLLWLQPLRLP